MGIIAIITDYGGKDWFAGEMKGAILRIASAAVIVDITNEIPPGDIRTAAFSLRSCFSSFPAGTVFCVVVDPGVGTTRAAIAAACDSYYFVGPDNGVLSWALNTGKKREVRRIECPDLLPPLISNTFHGRDIFGPIAAHCSGNIDFSRLGPLLPDIVELPWPPLECDEKHITGTVIYIDRFGNAITTIDGKTMKRLSHTPQKVRLLKYGTDVPLHEYFQQVPSGQGLAYMGSGGYLEIAINNANAAAIFGLHIGDKVEVK